MELTIDNFTYSIGKNRDIKLENGIYYFKCCKCGKYKPVEEFEKRWNHSKTEKNNLRSDCKKCRCEESRLYHFYRRRRYTDQVAKDIMIHLDKFKHDMDYHTKVILLRHAKQYAKKIGIEFAITIKDINIPALCPILNKPFILHDKSYTYSIDRIDNSKGYIKGNVAIISRLANIMKNKATEEELTNFSKNILSYIKKQSKLRE